MFGGSVWQRSSGGGVKGHEGVERRGCVGISEGVSGQPDQASSHSGRKKENFKAAKTGCLWLDLALPRPNLVRGQPGPARGSRPG